VHVEVGTIVNMDVEIWLFRPLIMPPVFRDVLQSPLPLLKWQPTVIAATVPKRCLTVNCYCVSFRRDVVQKH